MRSTSSELGTEPPKKEALAASFTLVVFFAIGILAFAPILKAWFVTDDWEFMVLAAPAKSIAIWFAPIVGRYIRPITMAIFYVYYRLFGLNPVPYHLTMVVLHIVNAWLVTLLAARLGLSRLVALGAGLIFLVFAGHSEAVSWLGGQADTLVTTPLVLALLLFDRTLKTERSAMPLTGACLLLALGLLAKETAVVGPGLLLAYGGSRLLMPLDAADRRRTIVRTLTVVLISGAVVVIYLGLRIWIFGTVVGTYPAAAPIRLLFAESRAFVLRTFLPPGQKLAGLWIRGYDILLIGAGALWLAFIFVRRPDTRRPLAFLVLALAITLVLVVPSSISLMDTVTERYVYAATVFSSILTAWSVELLFGRVRVLAAIVILSFAALNVRDLERANRGWVAAGDLARAVTGELIARVRASPPSTRTFVLNVPDTAASKYVVRGALYGSFHLMAPDIAFPERRIAMIASTAAPSTTEHTRVERTSPRAFTVTPDGGVFLQAAAVATSDYSFQYWNAHGYAITFNPVPHALQVLYVSDGHVQTAAILPGAPFGSLDLPAGSAVCTGDALRFSGWALQEQPGVDVAVEPVDRPASLGSLGTVTWKSGTRPDVTTYFRDFPDSDRAEWNWFLPCSLVKAVGGRLDLRVVATGRDGARTILGTRTVTLGQKHDDTSQSDAGLKKQAMSACRTTRPLTSFADAGS